MEGVKELQGYEDLFFLIPSLTGMVASGITECKNVLFTYSRTY